MIKKLLLILSLVFLGHSAFSSGPDREKGWSYGPDIVEVAESYGIFNTLLSATELTGLKEVLATTKNITVYAPIDEAFTNLPDGVLDSLLNDPVKLRQVLLYHVSLQKYDAKKIIKSAVLPTALGKIIQVTQKDGKVFLNDSEAFKTNIKAKNGIIHVIDRVLIPSENTANNLPTTAEFVDVQKYLGTWYEVGRYQNSFQKDCAASKAEYSLQGHFIKVKNSCQLKNADRTTVASGIAVVADKLTFAKLKVSFIPLLNYLGLGRANYWILYRDTDYNLAIIGDPSRKFLWILSRTPKLDREKYQAMVDIAVSRGFSAEKIIKSSPWRL